MQFFSRKYIFSYLYKLLCKKQIAASYSLSWEQRKLGDVVKEITRNDPESEAPIMMITANNGFIEQSERYAFNNAGESLKKYILLKKGELAYNHGASKLRPYGSCFALTTAENARIPFVYHCFSAENQNAEFMSIELNGAETVSYTHLDVYKRQVFDSNQHIAKSRAMSFINDKHNTLIAYKFNITSIQSSCFIFYIAHLLNRSNNQCISRV